MTVVIVGAGVGGLYLARELRKRGVRARVLEARAAPGGRVRSVYDDQHRLLYEAGPWRVPCDHRRALALFRELGVPLAPLATPTLPHAADPKAPGLSTWDALALAHGPHEADRLDLATGYAGQTHVANGSEPYTTDAPRFYVAPGGFAALVEALARDADVAYDHRVVDARRVDGRYELRVSRRTGHNTFAEETIACDALYVCVPPGACRAWHVFRAHARSVMSAVEAAELHHIYVKHPHPPGVHARDGTGLLAQTVSSQYDNDWFQASYSGGRIARLWHHLRLASPRAFFARLRAELAPTFGVPEDAAWRSHFWPVAFHRWRTVPGFDLDRAVRAAVKPNAAALPHVFLAGEAFSSHQAWMEGALETAQLALAARPSVPRCLPERHVFVEGFALDVDEWMGRHPGGAAPLENHLGEDVTALMRHVQHSDHAWAIVHALKAK